MFGIFPIRVSKHLSKLFPNTNMEHDSFNLFHVSKLANKFVQHVFRHFLSNCFPIFTPTQFPRTNTPLNMWLIMGCKLFPNSFLHFPVSSNSCSKTKAFSRRFTSMNKWAFPFHVSPNSNSLSPRTPNSSHKMLSAPAPLLQI